MKGRSKNVGAPKPGVPGMAVMEEAVAPAHGFKRGGKVGMTAAGEKAKARADRMPRKKSGGAVTMRGRSPYSAAGNQRSPAGTQEDD